jgi:predicted nuclease of predicted toxin-antitoxin system
MKLIIDENVSYGVVNVLRTKKWEIIAIADKKNKTIICDNDIYKLALQEKAIIITRDYHFTNPIRFPIKPEMSVIYVRHGNLTSSREIEIIDKFLSTSNLNEIKGKLVTLYYNRVSIR